MVSIYGSKDEPPWLQGEPPRLQDEPIWFQCDLPRLQDETQCLQGLNKKNNPPWEGSIAPGSVADPDRFGPDPDPTSENRPDPDPDSDPDSEPDPVSKMYLVVPKV